MFMIPLGLYRTADVNLKVYKEQLSKGLDIGKTLHSDKIKDVISKEINYVVTNPNKETRLKETDVVFVLAKNDPGDPETWDDYNDNNKDMFDANQNKLMKDINDMMFKQRKTAKKKMAGKANTFGS